ncbi:hypothetical protein APHAL10511_007426 [Amanita phalloides]|nr:hypothetical protein APHAL10511_007426 [Amanita phalloides]
MNCISSPQRLGLAPESNGLPRISHRVAGVRKESTEHTYQLAEGKNRAWATLKIYSLAKSPKSLPTFIEREPINATLEIHAEKGDSIHQITATVTGRIITGANSTDAFTFLSETLPVWSKSPESSGIPSPSQGVSANKLAGHCVWPISMTLPKAVNVPGVDGEACFYRLPETFLERHTKVSVQYDLSLVICRGKLRTSNIIKTAFGFVPHTRPEVPSFLRQLAYREGTPLPGPSCDPDGWKTLQPVVVHGMLKARQVEVRCSLSLAKPLSYARGSVLPCYMTLEGHDNDALDAFSMPTSIVVHLRRRVKYYQANSSARQGVAWNESFENMGSAIWWPVHNSQDDHYTRHMEGEIRLAKDLRPTSAMGHYSLSYSVALCPFDLAFGSSEKAPLISEPVEITTLYAKGPRPIAYSPPAYEQPLRRTSELYIAPF